MSVKLIRFLEQNLLKSQWNFILFHLIDEWNLSLCTDIEVTLCHNKILTSFEKLLWPFKNWIGLKIWHFLWKGGAHFTQYKLQLNKIPLKRQTNSKLLKKILYENMSLINLFYTRTMIKIFWYGKKMIIVDYPNQCLKLSIEIRNLKFTFQWYPCLK